MSPPELGSAIPNKHAMVPWEHVYANSGFPTVGTSARPKPGNLTLGRHLGTWRAYMAFLPNSSGAIHHRYLVSVPAPLQPSVPVRAPLDRSQGVVMGKVPVRLKEVAYTLSPYHQRVMSGLWKDIPYKMSKKFHENWVSAFTFVLPIVGTYMYAENYKEKEKLHHRY